MKLVTVSTLFNPAEAQLVRSQLEAAGFHAIVAHEIASVSIDGYAMAAGGIEVQVPETEAEDARELLTAPPTSDEATSAQ